MEKQTISNLARKSAYCLLTKALIGIVCSSSFFPFLHSPRVGSYTATLWRIPSPAQSMSLKFAVPVVQARQVTGVKS